MLKKTPIRIILGLALALSFPASAHAGDAYPTVTFAYPIIDQKIVDALTEPSTNQTMTITPYIYDGGNDQPVSDDSAVELRGYHLFYVSQNNPNNVFNLNDPLVHRTEISIGESLVLIFWDGSPDFGPGLEINGNLGFLISLPNDSEAPSFLKADLTGIYVENSDLVVANYANIVSLQGWISFVDDLLNESEFGFPNNSKYLDFHRQIGTYEGEGESFSPLADSYFRVYKTGTFYEVPQAVSAAPIRQTTNLSFNQSFYGTDKLADPKGEMRVMLDAIDAKYGKLIKS